MPRPLGGLVAGADWWPARTGGRRGLLALLTGVLLNAAFLTLAGPANNESFYFHRAVS
ncbi:hypothetical protein [Catenulispora pinisilvae]|uniref:hypothetical protein n=1 Tax=Catenulispora pinisilvae TaxID=2705253 RepID=UPI001891620E|nr:hypothetical protein [Catenulispora pinisilvae]